MSGLSALRSALVATAVSAVCLATSAAVAWEPEKEVEFISHSNTTSSTWNFLNEISEIAKEEGLLPNGARIRIIEGARGAKARSYVAVEHAGDPHVVQVLAPTQINGPILVSSEVNHEKFRGIANMLVTTKLLAVNAKSDYQTVDDLISAAKAQPGAVKQGGGFVGTTSSLINRILEQELGIDLTYVPFDDQGVIQLVGGHVDFIIERPEQIYKFVESGDLRILAASTTLDAYPDVPTFEEAGFNFTLLDSFQGLWTSEEVPQEAIDFYVEMLERVRKTDRYKKYLADNQATELWLTGAELDSFLQSEYDTYLKLNTEMGLIEKQ